MSGVEHDAELSGFGRQTVLGRLQGQGRQSGRRGRAACESRRCGPVGGGAVISAQFNDEAVRVRLHADGEIRSIFGVEHNSRHARGRLSHAHARQRGLTYVDGLANQCGSENGIVQIEVDAFRRHQAMHFVRHLIFHVDNDGASHGRRPVTKPSDFGQNGEFFRRGSGCVGCELRWVHQIVGNDLRCGRTWNKRRRRWFQCRGHFSDLGAVHLHAPPHAQREQRRYDDQSNHYAQPRP